MRTVIAAFAIAIIYIIYASAQTVTPAPAAMAAACVYNSTPPTVTSGRFVYVQCDSTGYIRIAP